MLSEGRLKDKVLPLLTPNMATPFGPFNNVPNEMLLNILGSVNATDHLSVKLVSKRFRGWATDIDTTTLTLAEVVRCHAAIEAAFPRNRELVRCCCTHCGLVKDTAQFSDPDAKKTKANRTCIACGIRRKKYSHRCLPTVGGQQRIPCHDCLRPISLYDGWKLKSAEETILLDIRAGKIYCEHCLESRLRFVTCPPTLHDFLLGSSVAGLSVLWGSEPEGQSIRGSTTEKEID